MRRRRGERVEERELKEGDRQKPPREGSQAKEMQQRELEKAREKRRHESPLGR